VWGAQTGSGRHAQRTSKLLRGGEIEGFSFNLVWVNIGLLLWYRCGKFPNPATKINSFCYSHEQKLLEMLSTHVPNAMSTTRLRICSSCSKSLKSGSAVLMALDQPFCSERCRSEFVFTQATPNSEPYTRAYRQRSEGQGVFISDPKRSKDSPQSPREFIQLYPVTQPRWSESSLAT